MVLNISGMILKAPKFKSNLSTMRLLFFLELIHYDFIALYIDDCVLRRLEESRIRGDEERMTWFDGDARKA